MKGTGPPVQGRPSVQYELEIGRRLHQVIVERAGLRFVVTVDGRTHHVDGVQVDARTLSLMVERAADPRGGARETSGPGGSYDVTVVPDPARDLLIVGVGPIPVQVAANGRRQRRGGTGGAVVAGPHRIVAPMPGKIVRVAIERGETVRARQTLVVIEAMKMENELRAGRDGIVTELHAREGSSVEAGTLLAVVG
jgi:biotin carboxyl carrier protein